MPLPNYAILRPRECSLRETQREDGTPMGALPPAPDLGCWGVFVEYIYAHAIFCFVNSLNSAWGQKKKSHKKGIKNVVYNS